MSSNPRSYPPLVFYGSLIPSSYQNGSIGFPIQSATVINNYPGNLAIFPSLPSNLPAGGFPWGGIIVPAAYPQNVPIDGWTSFAFATDGTVPFANSSLVIFLSEQYGGLAISPLGPSAWGGGSAPASLQPVSAGNAFLFWQVNQFYLYLTGSLSGNQVIDGSIETAGSTAGFIFVDRDLIGNDFWEWDANAGTAMLGSSVFGTVLIANESGSVTAPGSLHSPNLQSWHLLNNPTGASVSGSGVASLTSISIAADVPASAIGVAFNVVFSSTGSQIFGIFNANPNTNAQVSGISPGTSGVLGLPTAQTLWYTIIGSGAWSLTIYPTAYLTPS
jgi:hypothetical protein